jgi:drug/metabolite transporter (DMT)-like permease
MNFRFLVSLLLLGAIWGSSFPLMLIAVKDFQPLALIEVRVVVGAIMLLFVLAMRGQLASLRGYIKEMFILGVFNSAIPFSLFAYAAKYQTAGLSSVLNATAPLFGALIAVFWLREKLKRAQVVGLLVGFVGVVVLITSKSEIQGDAIAIAAGLMAAFLYGAAAHYSKSKLHGCSPLAVSAGSLVGASLFLLPFIPWSLSERSPSMQGWGCAVCLGVLCTGIAYILYFRLIATHGPANSMTVAYLIPIFGVLWGFLFLNEPVTPSFLLGGSIVLVGTVLVTWASKPSSKRI